MLKPNLKDFPELFKPQGRVAVPTIDLKDSLEVLNLIRRIDEWKTCFEKELRELSVTLTKPVEKQAESVRVWRIARNELVKEILGETEQP